MTRGRQRREPSGSGASCQLPKIQQHLASFVQGLGKAVTDCLQELPEWLQAEMGFSN
jgi:hypothetical protein